MTFSKKNILIMTAISSIAVVVFALSIPKENPTIRPTSEITTVSAIPVPQEVPSAESMVSSSIPEKIVSLSPIAIPAAATSHSSAGPSLFLPALGISAPVTSVGLEPNGELHVPANTTQVGWYKYGPRPGDTGPAVLTAHHDYRGKPGLFYKLGTLKPGDTIVVSRSDGSTLQFIVQKLETYRQSAFPTAKVYSASSSAALRLITCAGTYDKTTKRFTHNLVVYATLKKPA